ncbi:hypothetical protein WR25_16292 [Diploscapter pachys]|uniref:C-type lectin domain-containing protein n=1 Tax=Diploscapter pachys TaxID=2018661 RepID=A0A2A2KIH8_9BILA|nr:hypothetical protein WR25_16292 [Diploscapter pachys]
MGMLGCFPLLTFIAIIASINGQTCVDTAFDCGAKAGLCNNRAYTKLMTKQCPKTCGFCKVEPATTTTEASVGGGRAGKHCPDGWSMYDDACYKENDYVAGLTRTGSSQKGDGMCWIGLKRDRGDNWYWTDKTVWDYRNWAPSEPDQPGTQYCVQITSDVYTGYPEYYQNWNSYGCNAKLRSYVCKRDVLRILN